MTDSAATKWAGPGEDRDAQEQGWVPGTGEVVDGRYRVERVIGIGGMGAVVAARHLQLDEPVAMKFLHPRLAKDLESLERFLREARAASRIKCEHVVRIHDVGSTERGLPYIAMELLEGNDLGEIVAKGPLDPTLAADCVLQAAEALAEAHRAGIVHRDVKPSNLWLARRSDGSPLVKVLDFGISKLASHDGDSKLTDTRAVFGSPAYMSPEQIRSAKRVDHRTDIWALGVVLYELLTAHAPFEADNVAGILAAITADEAPPLRAFRPDVPASLERVVAGCLVKDPAQRSSIKELAHGLRPFASAAGVVSATRLDMVGPPRVSLGPPTPNAPIPVTAASVEISRITRRRRSPWRVLALGVLLAGAATLGAKALRLHPLDVLRAHQLLPFTAAEHRD